METDRLGLYEVLHRRGPLTVAELAEASGMHPRYAREWLGQQTDAGLLDTGTVMRPDVLRGYAREEGFAESRCCPSSTRSSGSTSWSGEGWTGRLMIANLGPGSTVEERGARGG